MIVLLQVVQNTIQRNNCIAIQTEMLFFSKKTVNNLNIFLNVNIADIYHVFAIYFYHVLKFSL